MQLMKNAAASAVEWIMWAAKALGASVMAFVGSKQVWAAGVLFAFLGYYSGFLMTAGKVSSLSATNSTLQASNKQLLADKKFLTTELAKLAEQPKPKADVPAAEPVATPTPVVRPKKPIKATPAVVEDKPWWKVFQ